MPLLNFIRPNQNDRLLDGVSHLLNYKPLELGEKRLSNKGPTLVVSASSILPQPTLPPVDDGQHK